MTLRIVAKCAARSPGKRRAASPKTTPANQSDLLGSGNGENRYPVAVLYYGGRRDVR